MEKDVINIYKPLGLTPLEAIEAYRKKHPEYSDIKMGYAGRLDPLAEGVLIVLTGETLKDQKRYMFMDKEYEAEIIFGFSTDTYDLLGISKTFHIPTINKKDIGKILRSYEGKNKLPFPPYSSYKIKGKPLFWWARNKRLNEIDIPKTDTEIYSTKVEGISSITGGELLSTVNRRIDLVSGDFRQEKIKRTWYENLRKKEDASFPVMRAKISCSSGTYIRSIAHDMGRKINSGGVLMHLLRTRVGDYNVTNSEYIK